MNQPETVTLSPDEVRAAEQRESDALTAAMQSAEKQIMQHRLIQLSGELARVQQENARLRAQAEQSEQPLVPDAIHTPDDQEVSP